MRKATSAVTATFLLCVTALLGGCGIHKEYVKADKATFDAVAPEYKSYVLSDGNLDSEAKARRLRTVELWRVRIEEAGK